MHPNIDILQHIVYIIHRLITVAYLWDEMKDIHHYLTFLEFNTGRLFLFFLYVYIKYKIIRRTLCGIDECNYLI